MQQKYNVFEGRQNICNLVLAQVCSGLSNLHSLDTTIVVSPTLISHNLSHTTFCPSFMDSDDITLRLVTVAGEELETYVVSSISSGKDLYEMVLRNYPAPGNAAVNIVYGEKTLQGNGTLQEQGLEDGSHLTYVKRPVTTDEQKVVIKQVFENESGSVRLPENLDSIQIWKRHRSE